jgi:hypothetical protein
MKIRQTIAATAVVLTAFGTGAANASSNLIVNGDFSAGNTGFTSDYGYVDSITSGPTSGSMYPEGLYTIWNNPIDVHPSWVDAPSAPTMLIENGDTTPNKTVWKEAGLVGVTGQTYNFSADIMNVCCNASFGYNTNAPSELLFQVSNDGFATWTTILDYTTSPGSPAPNPDDGIIKTETGLFTDSYSGEFDIRAIDGINAASGNDFGITNLNLSAVPEPATWAMMLIGFGAVGFMMRGSRRKQSGAVVTA